MNNEIMPIIANIIVLIWTISFIITVNHYINKNIDVNIISFLVAVLPIINTLYAIYVILKKYNIKDKFKELFK